jgi:hypothetical protein
MSDGTERPGITLPFANMRAGRVKISRPTASLKGSTDDPRWWLGRSSVLLLCITVWLAIVVVYTWPSIALTLYRLIVDGGVLLLWLCAATGVGAWAVPLFRSQELEDEWGLLQIATAAALGVGILGLLTLGLGLIGWLNQPTAIGLLGVGILAGIIRLVRDRWSGQAERFWRAGRAGWGWLILLAVPFVSVMTAGSMLPPYLLWSPDEPHGYDVVEYHLQIPREWYEAGRIIPLHHNVFSFFPFNVEMHYLLAMHLRGGPWAGMYLATMMHGAMILLSVLAACGFALRLARNTPQAATAPVLTALAMLTTPWLPQLGAIAYDEGGFLLFSTLAIGWSALALRDPERRIARFTLAGVMAGFACGVKLTAVPEVLVAIGLISLIVLIFTRASQTQSLPQRLAGPFVFGLAGLLIFSPWLIRTYAWSGNPVFPELAPVLGQGDFSQIQVERWQRAHAPQPAQRPLSARFHALGTELLWSWQYGYVLIPLALISIAWNWREPEVQFLGAMLFLLAVFWLGFTHLQSRFLILAVPICAILIGRLPWYLGVVIAAQAVIAFVPLHLKFASHIEPFAAAIGTESLEWMTPKIVQDQVPPDATLVLVGDAKAFLYQRPMSRLRYRTIFDAGTSGGRGVLDAWAGPEPRAGWLVVDPNELKRFESYQPFPAIPPEIAEHREPFLIHEK